MAQDGAALVLYDRPDWVDENYLFQLFMPTKAVMSLKVSRVRVIDGGRVALMEMNSRENAEGCIRAYNGTVPPNVQLTLKMTWAEQYPIQFEGASASVLVVVLTSSQPFVLPVQLLV